MDATVSGLVRKRAEIAGQIEIAREHLSVLEQQLAHIDGALTVFGYDQGRMPIKPTYKRQQGYFQRGELVRLVLDTLRAKGPSTVPEITAAIMQAKGIDPEQPRAAYDVRHKVAKTLKRRHAIGSVDRAQDLWSLKSAL